MENAPGSTGRGLRRSSNGSNSPLPTGGTKRTRSLLSQIERIYKADRREDARQRAPAKSASESPRENINCHLLKRPTRIGPPLHCRHQSPNEPRVSALLENILAEYQCEVGLFEVPSRTRSLFSSRKISSSTALWRFASARSRSRVRDLAETDQIKTKISSRNGTHRYTTSMKVGIFGSLHALRSGWR
jgi:hypothetical protein